MVSIPFYNVYTKNRNSKEIYKIMLINLLLVTNIIKTFIYVKKNNKDAELLI